MEIENSHWTCRTQRPLHQLDFTVLTNLYQPIIGACALSLYITLSHQVLVGETHRRSLLMKTCAISPEQFTKSRHLLEGVGLLNTFSQQMSKDQFCHEYELIPPLSPKQFFISDVLSLNLYNLLGQEHFFALKTYFADHIEADSIGLNSENITKSFQDIFGTVSPNDMKKLSDISDPVLSTTFAKDFDEGKMPKLNQLDLSIIKLRLKLQVNESEWTEELIYTLEEICFLYKLDEYEILKALQNPYITENGQVDIYRLKSYIKSEYRLKSGGFPVIVEHKNDTNKVLILNKAISTNNKSEVQKHIEQLAHMDPLDLLEQYQHGAKVPGADIDLVKSLTYSFGLADGVINILLEYVLLNYDYKLPRSLVEKIAGHWKRLGIKTAQEAFEHAKKEMPEVGKRKTYDSKKIKEDKLPRSLIKQLAAEKLPAEKPVINENLAETQARIRLKLSKMREQQKIKMKEKGLVP